MSGPSKTCERCEHLAKPQYFHTPALLKGGLAVVRANVADGTLREEALDPRSEIASQPPLTALDEKQLPDVFDYRFLCSNCGTRFRFTGDTYHGRSASWTQVGPVTKLSND